MKKILDLIKLPFKLLAIIAAFILAVINILFEWEWLQKAHSKLFNWGYYT